MKPHKHAEVIKAWADGAEIEYLDGDIWLRTPYPSWSQHCVYRIKPQPPSDVIRFCRVEGYSLINYDVDIKYNNNKHNLKLIWDGKTGELKRAEVL